MFGLKISDLNWAHSEFALKRNLPRYISFAVLWKLWLPHSYVHEAHSVVHKTIFLLLLSKHE